MQSLRTRVTSWLRRKPLEMASVSTRIEDAPNDNGWTRLAGGHDYDPAQVQELYADALTAWRKNPIAFRIISITTDYVVGDALQLSSPLRSLERFIRAFWDHPQNRLNLRLEAMCEELARAGDLFVALFRNPADGMSYLRFVTKDRILRIETAPNDWENEIAYVESLEDGSTRTWLSPSHPQAAESASVLLHYAVNRPLGALLGESDLTTMIPWLQRYSRMLEDRVRLHGAMRAFLWIVTVPANRIREKQEQYHGAPESGNIIIKDESESWEPQSPNLHAADAGHDLEAVRGMIDAGSGYPRTGAARAGKPTWRRPRQCKRRPKGTCGAGSSTSATSCRTLSTRLTSTLSRWAGRAGWRPPATSSSSRSRCPTSRARTTSPWRAAPRPWQGLYRRSTPCNPPAFPCAGWR